MEAKVYKKDIKKWTADFGVLIIGYTQELKKNGVDFDMISQIRRSGTSIRANVIALRSLNETNYWLNVINAGYKFASAKSLKVREELNEIGKVIATIIINLNKPGASYDFLFIDRI
jgi:hypothetical protein